MRQYACQPEHLLLLFLKQGKTGGMDLFPGLYFGVMSDAGLFEPLINRLMSFKREFDTPTVWNALESFKLRPNTQGFTRPGMLLRTPADKLMVGYAATAKVPGIAPPTDQQKELMFTCFQDVLETENPVVAVIQDIVIPDCNTRFSQKLRITSRLLLSRL
jgi:hypothetical protein